MNFNRVTIVGRLTANPETRSLPSGQTLTTFSLATSRFWTDQQGQKQQASDFHNIVAFGKLGEICAQYLIKGSLALVDGRLQTRSWEGQDGVKKYRTEIVMQSMQLGPKPQGSYGTTAASIPARNNFQARPAAKPHAMEPAEEDIPVIEADEPLPANTNDKEGEVNVDNIPF